ncbi:MAG TPA: serine--tRNA ligase [Candidatus Enterousia intestinigallinarum]|uniref:Serine--tRNA ligase n=1 Tax=Candidatus Enterousia intestinigallinarum TaxID=2840790 RepID=A0A9D1JWV0_9PROT|nr:serine--tRNA ligase [Candidatus Enterousia intestinigallinarum]
MLDIRFIRENPEVVKNACRVKGFDDNVDEILALDTRVRELKTVTQNMTAEKNKITREIPTATDKAPLIARSKQIGDEIAADLAELADKEAKLNDLMHRVPQIPDASAPIGPDDSANVEVRRVGTPREFDFTPRAQWDLLDLNGWWAPEKIAQICGTRTYCLIGEAAELQLAIETYVIQKLIKKGFRFIECPSITKPQTIFDAGHFMGADLSIMNNDVFMLTGTDRCLAGTAEIILNSLHSGEILSENELPIKYAGFSPCFRKEAGAAGRDTRGLARFHQFNKVEQYVFCKPEQSDEMHELLLNNLCEVMEDFDLPYRVIANSTGDMGFNKVKMNDVEAWVPSENAYKEVGSCSSIGTFQARRTNTRYRENGTNEVKFCATLNNTGIAVPRALVPFLENNQNADGSVNIPEKLQPLMGGRTKIGGKH